MFLGTWTCQKSVFGSARVLFTGAIRWSAPGFGTEGISTIVNREHKKAPKFLQLKIVIYVKRETKTSKLRQRSSKSSSDRHKRRHKTHILQKQVTDGESTFTEPQKSVKKRKHFIFANILAKNMGLLHREHVKTVGLLATWYVSASTKSERLHK